MSETAAPGAHEALLEGEGFVVCPVRFPMISKVMVGILDKLLRQTQGIGAVLSLDRPHSYISRLLERNGIPQDRILYIDAVMGISGESPEPDGGAEMLPAPFCINILSDFINVCGPRFSEKRPGFLLIDNLSALTSYVSEECLKRFLESLVVLSRQTPGLRCVFVLDKDAHPRIYEMVRAMGAREVSP
ncbi:MAG: hypothetical protein QXH42_02160 [Thermoplasmata archaeon]